MTRKQRESNKRALQDCLVCADCKQAKMDVKQTTCPYAEDVHGVVVDVKLCNHCYSERCQNI